MPKPNCLELGDGERIPILYEDRSVLAIDKPAGWMLVPFSWQKTDRNLQAAITSSIAGGDWWARSRNLKFLRHVHRLDAGTTGILLLAKSPGALDAYGDLFESRKMEKVYLAVVHGIPKQAEWACHLKLTPNPDRFGTVKVDPKAGKTAETHFRILESRATVALIAARPITGRTHQIRIHLAKSGHPVLGDGLYGPTSQTRTALALRAVSLAYLDPFTKRRVRITASSDRFVHDYGFAALPEVRTTAAGPSVTGGLRSRLS